MFIEIKGINSTNQGSQMMLLTIIQELGRDGPFRFVIAPHPGVCEYPSYAPLGIYPKAWLEYKGFQFGNVARILPRKLRQMYGLVLDEEVRAVLDASGFAYSDQWGEGPARRMARDAARWKKAGKKIILMPQAFGPFKSKNMRSSMKRILESADLVFARDDLSYRLLQEIGGNLPTIKGCPDFTMRLKGAQPTYFDPRVHQVAIVPNQRMIDKTRDGERYLEILIKAIAYVRKHGLSPFFLILGGNEDLNLSNVINQRIADPLPVVDEKDPRYLKGLIRSSLGMVGSRFHGLANALYEGVIAIGIGWSQKYRYLFDDMDFAQGLLRFDITDNELYERLDLLTDPKRKAERSSRLFQKKEQQEQKVQAMFEDVKRILGGER